MEIVELLITIMSSVIIGGYFTLKFNYNSLFAENVSKSRMEWISNFREEVSIIIATLEIKKDTLNKSCNESDRREKSCQYVYDACKARAKLRTRLNLDTSRYGNEYNKVFDEVLLSLKFDGTDDVEECTEQLVILSRKILEPEWQKVKREARGRDRE